MVVFWTPSKESKVIAAIFLVALILQMLGTSTNYLAVAEFTVPKPTGLDPQTLYGKSHVGFMRSCLTFLVNSTEGMKVVEHQCLHKPIEDWQTAVLVLNVFAGLSCTIGLILVILNIIVSRFQDKIRTKLAIAVCTAVSSLTMIAAMVTVELNKSTSMKLLHVIYVKVDYHLRWSFYVYCVSSILYGSLHLLLLVGVYITKSWALQQRLCITPTIHVTPWMTQFFVIGLR
ncbi:hypothetical protein EGW08_008605 [Elysia chlorotica]|uniref:Uncharacterized protein n=1 Tax=Elysia chlorotica TaxID=188477 RepID=A0A433TQ04_ELYCH|nr:hypothetical protein EGW08_008605 [Elysia chlorotica]